MRTTTALALLSSLVLASLATSCSDPVRDAEIEALGDEDPAVPRGPEHRPGQPCVLCHSAGGPASSQPFVVGGTVFETDRDDSPGADGVRVAFVDSVGVEHVQTTNAAGNFFILESEWPDLAFPFKVGIKKGADAIPMTSTINREGSCAYCHRPGAPSRDSVGQIYLKKGGGP